MSDGEEPCNCLDCMIIRNVVAGAEPLWGEKTSHDIASYYQVDDDRRRLREHFKAQRTSFLIHPEQLALEFYTKTTSDSPDICIVGVEIQWNQSPPAVKSAGKK